MRKKLFVILGLACMCTTFAVVAAQAVVTFKVRVKGGESAIFKAGEVGKKRTLEVENQGTEAGELTKLEETFKGKGEEFITFNPLEIGKCRMKGIYEKGEACLFSAELVKEPNPCMPAAEATITAEPPLGGNKVTLFT